MSERFKSLMGGQLSNEKLLENELFQFITFIKRAPLSIQRQLHPYCFELKREFPNDNRVKNFHENTFGET